MAETNTVFLANKRMLETMKKREKNLKEEKKKKNEKICDKSVFFGLLTDLR